MDILMLAALVALGLVVLGLLFDSFVLGRKRLQQRLVAVTARSPVPVLTTPALARQASWAFFILLVFVIWRSMPLGLDLGVPLTLLLLLFAGTRLLDLWLLKPLRQRLAAVEDLGNAAKVSPYYSLTTMADMGREYFVVLAIIFVLRSFIFEPFKIPSGSMHPTLIEGDHIVVNKFSYGLTLPLFNWQFVRGPAPQVGEVAVFTPPHVPIRFIKRIAAGPGDHVRYDFINKHLYINGQRVASERLGQAQYDGNPVGRYQQTLGEQEFQFYLEEQTMSSLEYSARLRAYPGMGSLAVGGITLEPGYYFLVGDNRDFSEDSRYWGPVHESQIAGRAFAIWMNWPSLTSLPSFDRVQRLN